MTYYAIKDKESGKWVDEDNEHNYIEKDEIVLEKVFSKETAIDRLLCLKRIASFRKDETLDGIKVDNLVVVPVELKEVIDDPQEDVREYCAKAMLGNRIYLPIKESKPKWYEIKKDQMVRLDAIQSIEKQCEWRECSYYIRLYAVGNNCIDIRCQNEEEAIAKYNELKKLLEEV